MKGENNEEVSVAGTALTFKPHPSYGWAWPAALSILMMG